MKIYCSGIGGIGLSAYAALQRAAGHDVLGSDRSDSELLDDLRSQGITIVPDQNGGAIPGDTDLLVYSEAIPVSAPERLRATELGIAQQSYPEALAALTEGHRVIAVCGTHGKSSTTAMAARLLIEAGCDPTVVVGTKTADLNGRNWCKGKCHVKKGRSIFLLEACEYRRQFLQFHPEIILLTTCDGDHFDYYENLEAYRQAFVAFLSHLPPDGCVITHLSDPDCRAVAEASGCSIIDADRFPAIQLKTPGRHMRQNASLVLALASLLEIPQQKAIKILSGYAGSWRRAEQVGVYGGGIPVIDDYGHHPVEIRATLAALREAYLDRRLVCVFQPHTHDRTFKLYDDFTRSFGDVDLLIVPDVYDARNDIETARVDVPKFVKDIAQSSDVEVIEGHSLETAERMLREKILRHGDVLVCMGAGDVTLLAHRMVGINSGSTQR